MNAMQSIKQAEKQSTSRSSNLELLRIIAMLMIIAYHFSVHGGFEFSPDTITVNRLWTQFIEMGGKIGVNVFVLISGYFLVSAEAGKTGKIIRLWLQIFTYSILIFILFTGSGVEPFGIRELVNHCFPVLFSQWWFASTYFVLYLLSPYINKLLHALNKKTYQRFLVLLTVCWCIIPTLTLQEFQGNDLLWFIYLYALAGYIKLHRSKDGMKGSTCFFLVLVTVALTFLSVVIFDVAGTRMPFFGSHATSLYGMNRPPALIISILLLAGFSGINIGCRRMINVTASATFGVYLIHDNTYVRHLLWKTIFSNASYAENNLLIPYSLWAVAVVFVTCTVVELARICLLEKHYMGFVSGLAGSVDKYKEKLFSLSLFDKF